MRNEQFGFNPRHSTPLQLARLFDRTTWNLGEKSLTDAVFIDVAKTFDTIWIVGLLYKLRLLNFPPYIVHTISRNLRGRTIQASFQTTTPSRRSIRAGVAEGGLISSVLSSLYVNDKTSQSHHEDNMAIIGTSRKLTLPVSYLESYLHDIQRLLSEWRSPLMSPRAPR
jgi:hypothetical protein